MRLTNGRLTHHHKYLVRRHSELRDATNMLSSMTSEASETGRDKDMTRFMELMDMAVVAMNELLHEMLDLENRMQVIGTLEFKERSTCSFHECWMDSENHQNLYHPERLPNQ